MTLNNSTGVARSLSHHHQQQQQQQQQQQNYPTHPSQSEFAPKKTIVSPTASAFIPTSLPFHSETHTSQQPHPTLQSSRDQTLPASTSTSFTERYTRTVLRPPSSKLAASNRQRQSSRSPERVLESSSSSSSQGISGGWGGNVRRWNPRPESNNSSNTQMKKKEPQSTPSQQPPFKSRGSNTSIQSNSVPTTPNHHARRVNGTSRSPSPSSSCPLDSPRSAASEPVTIAPYRKPPPRCEFETALVHARRRMPYSLGSDPLEREKPKLEKLSQKQEEKLTSDMMVYFDRLKPTEDGYERRRKFLDKLQRLLNGLWPGHDIQVHAFGSTENHLSLTDSDVDVCITTKCKEVEHVCTLSRKLHENGMKEVVCIPGAKVPIVRIWDPEYEIHCDMNINNTLALGNTRMIKTYVEIDDRVRPLAMIIKHWTKQRLLNDAAGGGTLSSYTWICMILNFLQTRDPPILPALHQRPHVRGPPINGLDVSFDNDMGALRGFGDRNKESIGALLFAFFKRYGHDLNYEKNVVSVRHGRLLTKEEKNWRYMQNNRLCVEEPFNVERNLGNTADDISVRGLHMEFRRAHKILSEKVDLASCCEKYEFPPEEHHPIVVPQQPQSRPVVMSRSNSNNGRQRNGYSGNGNRGRNPGWNHRSSQNKRLSNGNNWSNGNLQPQYFTPDLYGYAPIAIQSQQEHILALQAQIQAHVQAQAQIAQFQAAQAHAAQMQSQQSQAQSQSQQSSSGNSNQEAMNAFHSQQIPLASYAYYAQTFGLNMFYPGLHETTTAPASPPCTPAMKDSRQGIGRGRRGGGFSASRSQSQPGSRSHASDMYAIPGYGRGISTTMPGSEDDEFADHSSNGNPPETPPEGEPDEYIGFYSIGGSLQQDLAVVDQAEEEQESFLEQKSMVDRQKRLSQEKLPPPLLDRSRDSSPLAIDRKKQFSHDKSQPLSFDGKTSRGPFCEDRRPVIVNGAISADSASDSDASFSNLVPLSEEIFPYESAYHSGLTDGASEYHSAIRAQNVTEPPQLFAQKLLEVHTQAAGSSPGDPPTGSKSLALPHNKAALPLTTAISPASLPKSPILASQIPLEDGLDSVLSSRLSPNLRQRAASQQLLWTNSRVPPLDGAKAKGSGPLEDLDLSMPLAPVPEAPSPSPGLNRREPEGSLPLKSAKPVWGNGARFSSKEGKKEVKKELAVDPIASTSAPLEKTRPKNVNNPKATRNTPAVVGNTVNGKSVPKSDSKPNWEKVQGGRTTAKKNNRKKKPSEKKPSNAPPANESERKGG